MMHKRALIHFRFGKVFGWLRRQTSSRRKQIAKVRSLYLSYGLQSNGCKLCGGNKFSLLAESDRYGFDLKKQICDECGLVQTYPCVSDQFLNEFYSHLYRPLYTKANSSVDYQSLLIEQKNKAVKLVQYLNNRTPKKLAEYHLIEIGCSSGGILLGSKPHFLSVQGCDLDVEGTNFARQNLGLNVETATMPSMLPLGPKVFLLSHVLEHLNHPLDRLSQIVKLMNEADLLVIMVPGLNAVKEGDYKYDLRRYFHIAHITDFTAGTLSKMADRAGLSPLDIDECINSIFKLSPSSKNPILKNYTDSLSNVVSIEDRYKLKKYMWFK